MWAAWHPAVTDPSEANVFVTSDPGYQETGGLIDLSDSDTSSPAASTIANEYGDVLLFGSAEASGASGLGESSSTTTGTPAATVEEVLAGGLGLVSLQLSLLVFISVVGTFANALVFAVFYRRPSLRTISNRSVFICEQICLPPSA